MAVYRLNDDLWFPDPHLGERSGLVAVGGDLSVKRLLLAYSNGFFPWLSFGTICYLSQRDTYQPLHEATFTPE